MKNAGIDYMASSGKIIEIINFLVASNTVKNKQLASNGRFAV